MFTSDKDDGRTALIYLIISLVLAFAGAVYEHFSFGVYSYFMIYAFAVPLVGGTLVYALADRLSGRSGAPGLAYRVIHSWMYHAAIATLTAGCIVQGILAICGRPNSLTIAYPVAAAVLTAVPVIAYSLRGVRAYTGH